MTVYREVLSPAEELVVLAIKDGRTGAELEHIHELYEQVGDEVVFKIAVDNKLVPMVAHGLMDALRSKAMPSHWMETHQQSEEKVNQFFEELDRLASILAHEGVPVVLIENGGIARGVYPCRGCFASSDVEILVDRDQLSLIDRVLRTEGYVPRSRERCASENSGQWDRDIRGWENYSKILTGGITFWLNIQWQPVLRRWVPMETGLTANELIARSVPIDDSTSRVRILAPEDNLLLCALHTASHSYVRGIGLRLHLDVDRLVRRVPINWDVVRARARNYRACTLVFPSLAIPKGLFGTPVPDSILQALVPFPGKRRCILDMVAQASVFHRGLHKFNPIQFMILETQLSDDGLLGGLERVFLPPPVWMKEGYKPRNNPPLLFCYVDRLIDLARRRYA
jgi:hypothetical protein